MIKFDLNMASLNEDSPHEDTLENALWIKFDLELSYNIHGINKINFK